MHPDDRERLLRPPSPSMRQAGRHEIRYRLALPDGRRRDVHALTEVRNGADGKPATLVGVLIDDTDSAERVRAQQAVSAKLAEALELAKVSVWRIDLQRRRIHYNDIGYRLTGVEPTARGHGPGRDARPGPSRGCAGHAACRRPGHGRARRGRRRTRYRNADGSYRHLLTRRVAERDAQGRVVALTGVSLDQTARIAERERAQALARRIQLVADAAGVGVWSIERREGEADRVEWNAQMFHIYGLPPDQPAPPVQEWMGQRVHADDRQRVADERRRARRAGSAGFETEFRIIRPDGSLRWVVCRSHREQRDGHSVLHGIHLDVTEQRALGEALRLHEQRLKLATQIRRHRHLGTRPGRTSAVVWEEQMYRLRGLQPDDPRTPWEIDQQRCRRPTWRAPAVHRAAPARLRALRVRVPGALAGRLAALAGQHRPRGARRQRRAARMVGLNWDITQRKRAERRCATRTPPSAPARPSRSSWRA